MRKILFITLIFFLSLTLQATEKHPMPEVEMPHSLTIQGNTIFVAGKSTVYIYQSPNKLIKQFGRKGEGPGEFREFQDLGLILNIVDKKLVISSNGKLSYFTSDGTFIKDIKTGNGLHYCPVKNNSVGIRFQEYNGRAFRVVALVDGNRQVIKLLSKKAHWFVPGKTISPIEVKNPRYWVMNSKIYAENHITGVIHIFDSNGKELGTAKGDYPVVEVSKSDQLEYHQYYKTHKYYKDDYYRLKHLIKFPDNYNPVNYFDCSDGKIYVLSQLRKDGANDLHIFDQNGKFLRRMMIKMQNIEPQEMIPLIRFANNKIYQLFEDPDEEVWTLHITDIPKG